MKIFLVCSLNDENYTQADYDFCNTFEEAKEKCIENVAEYYEISKEKVISRMEFRYDEESNTYYYSYQDDDENGNSFFVNQIIEIDVDKEDYLCIWHHAYDGVDFKVVKTSSDKECSDVMYEESDKVFKECGTEISIGNAQVVVDTTEEWEVWDIVKVQEVAQ